MLKLTSNILEEIKNGQKEDFELVDRVVLVNKVKVETSNWVTTVY